jgi:hypothetical protein
VKVGQAILVGLMALFAIAQGYKYTASSATRAACSEYKVGTEFSAVKLVQFAVGHNSRDTTFSELSEAVPNPLNIDDRITTVSVVTRTIKRDGIMPAAFTLIDQKGLRGKASLVTKAGFAEYTCNISFDKNRVTASLGTWN